MSLPIAPNPVTIIAQLQLILPASRNVNTDGPCSDSNQRCNLRKGISHCLTVQLDLCPRP